MQQLEAEELLVYLIDLLTEYLTEIDRMEDKENAFVCGEQIAYIECLEIVQRWEYAEEYGLDFKVEEKFPLFEKT